MTQKKQKILVAISGGVDSSVTAALLVREGHDVAGAFMKNWSDEADSCTGECGWQKERQDAMRVAATLGIPFHTFDFEEQYRANVVEYMVREYAAGRTPNPDVMCNKMVKFDLFLRRAEELGFDMIATGHYARIEREPNGTARLLAGVDTNKDQSYFLHQLNQQQLAKTFFPIGNLQKAEVRTIAREFALPTAEKKDSQGICFIGKVDLREFLAQKIPARAGPIVTTDGKVVGRHRGVAPYTIGQRHGFGVGGSAPYFVVEKDMRRNTLVVGHEDDEAMLFTNTLFATDAHWISGASPSFPRICEARIRYRQPLESATVIASQGGVRVDFKNPQRAVSPGQFVVFYDGATCLGGATISEKL